MPVPSKQFFAKVYDQDGITLLRTLAFDKPADGSMFVKSEPEFSARINAGMGELVLNLKAPFDSFLEGTTVNFMNIVDLYCSSTNPVTLVQTTRRLYRGYVSRYEPYTET